MEKIYSKVDPTKLLHIIHRKNDFIADREDIVPITEFLQMASLNLKKGQSFKPHKHIWKMRSESVIAQESWTVVKGRVKCTFYDINNTIIAEPILEEGDCSITLEGGHTYTGLDIETWVREFKTGPYLGQKLDKVFI